MYKSWLCWSRLTVFPFYQAKEKKGSPFWLCYKRKFMLQLSSLFNTWRSLWPSVTLTWQPWVNGWTFTTAWSFWLRILFWYNKSDSNLTKRSHFTATSRRLPIALMFICLLYGAWLDASARKFQTLKLLFFGTLDCW